MTNISSDTNGSKEALSRREILAISGLVVGIGSSSISNAEASGAERSAETEVAPGKSAALFPLAETAQGRVRGENIGGIKSFKGLPYGADTGGANRFLPPHVAKPWAGVRDATAFGHISPQVLAQPSEYGGLSSGNFEAGGLSEDCLNLNVWTPSLDKSSKLPVMVWLHGGGFYGGSANTPGLNGAPLSRFANGVVVTVNHRLGPFGYVSLADAGFPADFAQSSGAGLLDLVAALRWIKENIENFGGDANRVLIFGQSGGGGKTSVLMAMPSAKGLFHRAGIMSGFRVKAITREAAAVTTEAFLKTLGIKKGDVRKLQSLSVYEIVTAQATLEESYRSKGEAPALFDAVVDGTVVPRHPFDPIAPSESVNVPVIVSTARDERTYRLTNFDLDEAGLRAFMVSQAGSRAEEALKLYRAANPGTSPFIIQAQLEADRLYRAPANTLAERKAAQGGAPVWTYLWEMPSPAYGGRYGAPHAIDVGPSFHNVNNGLDATSSTFLRLSDQLASSWANFAATGDPNNGSLPHWPSFDGQTRAAMVFGEKTRVENDPRKAFREFWASI